MNQKTLFHRIRGAIFDIDGTLLDSMHFWKEIGLCYLAQKGVMPKKEFISKFNTLSLPEAAECFHDEYGISGTIEEICAEINKLAEDFYFYEVLPKKDAELFLKKLAEKKIPICAATATDRYLVEAALKRCGLLSYFSGIFTCTEVGCGKESPLVYEKAREFLGTPKEQTVIFEDMLFAVQTAKKAGFLTAGVADDAAIAERSDLRKTADVLITSFSEAALLL